MPSQFCVIFDLNGVIVNDERIHQQSWRELCKQHNLHPTEEDFKHNIFGRTEIETIQYLFGNHLTQRQIDSLLAKRVRFAIKAIRPNLAPVNGVTDLLTKLSNNHNPTGLATSSRVLYTNFVLDSLNIRHYFQAIATAEAISKGKPDPEIYFKVASLLQADPETCIAIEDSLSGIISAQRAGMKTVAITTTHTKKELSIADLTINSFYEIELSILDKILQGISPKSIHSSSNSL